MKQKIADLLQQTWKANYFGGSAPKVGRLFSIKKLLAQAGAETPGGEPGLVTSITVNDRVFRKVSRQLDAIWGSVIVTHGKPPHSILLNAPSIFEGVLLLSESLSLYLALEYGYKVVYVTTSTPGRGECDEAEALHDRLLSEVVEGRRGLASLITQTNLANLHTLSIAHTQSKLVQASICQSPDIITNFLAETKDEYNVIVFDSQSVFTSPWTVTMSKHIDMVLLVCSYANTRREVATNVLDTFTAGGVTVQGAVLTDREFPVPANLYRLIK